MHAIVFCNQVSGPLFRELVSDVAAHLGPCTIVTGTAPEPEKPYNISVTVLLGPAYDRRSPWRRVSTWVGFFLFALRHVLFGDRESTLFLVSNPPFLGFVGWLGWALRRRRYVVLIYDLYPGMLERLGRIRSDGILAQVWHAMNRLVWGRAACIFAIGQQMADNIRPHLRSSRSMPSLVVIPNWADGQLIRPMSKGDNPFALRHGLRDKLTVLYSGNLGTSHDLNPLLEAAARLRSWNDVQFMIIGDGVKFSAIEKHLGENCLTNVKLLPLQPESQLPWTLTSGDVAVVTFQRGAEGYMVPSKTYYYLAAGCALLLIAAGDNEVARLIERYACGLVISPDDPDAMVEALRRFRDDPKFLRQCQLNARRAQEQCFSRDNTAKYCRVLESVVCDETPAAI